MGNIPLQQISYLLFVMMKHVIDPKVNCSGCNWYNVNEWTSRYWNEKEQSSSSCHEAHEWSELEYDTSTSTVNPVYKGHSSWEYENVAFMSSYPFYTGSNCTCYSLMGKTRLPLILTVICYIGVPCKAGLTVCDFLNEYMNM